MQVHIRDGSRRRTPQRLASEGGSGQRQPDWRLRVRRVKSDLDPQPARHEELQLVENAFSDESPLGQTKEEIIPLWDSVEADLQLLDAVEAKAPEDEDQLTKEDLVPLQGSVTAGRQLELQAVEDEHPGDQEPQVTEELSPLQGSVEAAPQQELQSVDDGTPVSQDKQAKEDLQCFVEVGPQQQFKAVDDESDQESEEDQVILQDSVEDGPQQQLQGSSEAGLRQWLQIMNYKGITDEDKCGQTPQEPVQGSAEWNQLQLKRALLFATLLPHSHSPSERHCTSLDFTEDIPDQSVQDEEENTLREEFLGDFKMLVCTICHRPRKFV